MDRNRCFKLCLVCPFILSLLMCIVWTQGGYSATKMRAKMDTISINVRHGTMFRQVEDIIVVPTNSTPVNVYSDILASSSHLPDSESVKQHHCSNCYKCTGSSRSSSSSSSSSSINHFVIELLHWEQMTMAIHSLIQLAWFVADWNARVVEPFTRNSFFYGLNKFGHSCYPMSTIFDMDQFNTMLCENKIPPLATFDEFLESDSNNVFIIHLFYNQEDSKYFKNLKSPRSPVLDLFKKQNSSVVKCGETAYMKEIGKELSYSMNDVLRRDDYYKVMDYCCIDGLKGTDRKSVWTRCGIDKLAESNTIIVTDWRGVNNKANFRLFLPELGRASLSKPPSKSIYPFNKKVKSNAVKFLDSFSKDKRVLLIHFRSEKLAKWTKQDPKYFNNCVNESLDLANRLLSKKTTEKYTVACVTDTSIYGSRSCHNNCPGKTLMNDAVKQHKLNCVWYDPYRFRGIPDSTFVAAVEQEMMTMVDILVLVGGGSFQNQLKLRFLSKHGIESEIHQICKKT